MRDNFELHTGDINTVVSDSLSDCYPALNQYLLAEGISTKTRIGNTYEILNLKTVIRNPLNRCTVSLNRNSNIFFHLAEALWIWTGRDDLHFIEQFNSRFSEFTDDGKTLHGAYGKRLRRWEVQNNNNAIDQLYKVCELLNENPDSRRTVCSIWSSSKDLGHKGNDIPCNTQLMFRIKKEDFYITVLNRSNDLHWGFIANVFQFSFLGELMSIILDKQFVRQTHFSQSFHMYTNNELTNKVVPSDTHKQFYSRYPFHNFHFNFKHTTTSFSKRFSEIDDAIVELTRIVSEYSNINTINFENESSRQINQLLGKSNSIYEIAYLLILYISYKKELNKEIDKDEIRCKYANYLIAQNTQKKFVHADYYGLALNYFVRRMREESKAKYIKEDPLMGKY